MTVRASFTSGGRPLLPTERLVASVTIAGVFHLDLIGLWCDPLAEYVPLVEVNGETIGHRCCWQEVDAWLWLQVDRVGGHA